MRALKKACLYSLPPCKTGSCGPKDKIDVMIDFIIRPDKSKVKEIKEILRQFHFAYRYYQQIAQAYNKDVFDYEVIEAYWIGNKLLDCFKSGVIPFHLYDIVFVAPMEGWKFNDKLIDFCRINWGKVVKLNDNKAEVECPRLEKGVFRRIVGRNSELAPELAIGDYVSLHRKEIVEKLTKKEVFNLKKYTKRILKVRAK